MAIRKLLLASLFLTFFCALAIAQNMVTFHGTVTDNDGAPQEDVSILATAYFSDSSVVMLTLMTDNQGEYEGEIDTPGPNFLGWLAVSMVDCWGTTQTQNFQILTGSEDFTADFNYCEEFLMDSCLVLVLEEWHPGNELELVAWNPLGQNAEYLWSTGDTTQSIFPQSSGTYCVEATFPWGCSWTDCIEVSLDSNDFCFVYITTTQENDSTYTLVAQHTGIGPIEYFWSTGDTTQMITNVGQGTYCVAAFDASGCGDTTCIILDGFDFCEVYVWENPNGGLTAEGFGEPPITYLWSTGDSTQTIYPNAYGLYCVTATDVNGCSAESCYDYFNQQDSCFVYINAIVSDSNSLALEAIGISSAQTLFYEWNTGETTQIIYPTDPNQTYCVTLTDSEGCVSSACFDFGNYCYSWIDVDYVDTTLAVLSVWIDPIFLLPGSPQPSYLWSNGDTGPVLTVNESGMYCVTVTVGNNCVSESCAYVDFDSLGVDCDVWVYTFVDSSGNWTAQASPWGFGDFEYLWSNGETTQSIELDFPEQYACVTVTSSFGCTAVACADSLMQICDASITVAYHNNIAILTASVWSLEDSVDLIWSTGETEYSIVVETAGTYCLTINTPNCTFTTCADVNFGNTDSCGVWIAYDFDPLGILYSANAYGTSPLSYMWSTGDTTQSVLIDLAPPGICVTVTDAIGCVATACAYPNDSCAVQIYYEAQPVPSLHIDSYDPIASVIWSTGDSTEWIPISGSGIYCAEVTTIFGCSANVCYAVDSIPPGIQNVISGVVFGDTLTQAKGWVNFYAFNPNSGKAFIAVDSVQINPNGSYVSSELPDGVYIVKAIMTPGTQAAEDYLPTYYATATKWQQAKPIGLPAAPVSRDIFLKHTTGFNGGGVIAGYITDGKNIVAGEEAEIRGNLAGLPNVEVIIRNVQGVALHYAWSLENGAYRFSKLPFGTYRISYEIPGVTSPDIWVTLTPENPERTQVNLIVDGGTVAVIEPVLEEVKLYPNPAKYEVNIPVDVTSTKFTMQLVDMQGKVVKAGSVTNENGVINIDVRNFAPGLYHINLRGDQVIYYGRFIKQD